MDTWFERRVQEALAGWKLGRLRVVLPDGRTWDLGPEGEAETVELRVHDAAFFRRAVLGNDIGIGEAYMDGQWSSPDLAGLIQAFLANRAYLSVDAQGALAIPVRAWNWVVERFQRNTRRGSERNIHAHYDLGNEFYELFLDPTMSYSSAIFPDRTSALEEAQLHKYRIACEKLQLQPEDHLLEIGSGWGGLAIHAARETGCRVTTVTISRKQYEATRARVREAGLEGQVEVRYSDYRALEGKFDKVVSIEMLEAVGAEYWDAFFRKIDSVLTDRGRALIQVICVPDLRFAYYSGTSDWIRRYVFPGGRLPSVFELQRAVRRSSLLEVSSIEEIGAHYAPTLRGWRERFQANLEAVRGLGFPESFVRMWDFYLASCEASFETGWNRNVHLLLARPRSLLFCELTGS